MSKLNIVKNKKVFYITVAAISLIAVSFMFVLLFWSPSIVWKFDKGEPQVFSTKGLLNLTRFRINTFNEDKGRYPNLFELQELIDIPSLKESIADPNGGNKICKVLTGEGGWYYDPNKGEIRVNLLKPVKDYIKNYVGKYKDDIPSKW